MLPFLTFLLLVGFVATYARVQERLLELYEEEEEDNYYD